MPAERFASEESGPSATRAAVLWALPVVFLVGVWLWLVFSSGGYATKDWAFQAMTLGVAGIVIAALALFPRRPGQLSLAVLALFTGYAVWVLASNLWAESSATAWQATGRTFMYLLVLTLALTFFASARARLAFKYLVMAGALALLAGCVVRLWTAETAALFVGNRFVFPIGQANAASALFLIPFWPLVWLAAGPDEPAPVRGAAIGLATGLVGLALLTQSRGAVWSLGITLIFLFAVSPGRLRLLMFLVVPGLLMVYAYPALNSYWAQGQAAVSGGIAARTLVVAAVAAGFIGMIVALLEKWVKVSGRMKAIFGTVVLAGCAAGLIYGSITLTQDAGGPMAWFGDRWEQLAGEPALDVPAAAFEPDGTPVPSATRTDVWNDSLQGLRRDLLLGVGSGDRSPSGTADSLVLRVLSETGVVGGVLAFGAMMVSLAGILWPRTVTGWRVIRRRRTGGRPASRWGRDPLAYGWEMALLAAVAYWLVHANLEPLLQMTGITVPALLMLAAALASTDARARTMWPRLSRRLRHRPAGRGQGAEGAQAAEAGMAGQTGTAAIGPSGQGAAALARAYRTTRLRVGHPQPEGLLTAVFRVWLVVLSAAVVILAISDYLLARL
jgi:hypothetical protein